MEEKNAENSLCWFQWDITSTIYSNVKSARCSKAINLENIFLQIYGDFKWKLLFNEL